MPVKRNPRECTIEEELVRRVAAEGGIALKVVTPGRRGFVDRLVLMPGGRAIMVECKRPRGGRLSLHQIVYHRRIETLGVVLALIKNSEDIDALLGRKSGE
jgi:Holliday junction resolvase